VTVADTEGKNVSSFAKSRAAVVVVVAEEEEANTVVEDQGVQVAKPPQFRNSWFRHACLSRRRRRRRHHQHRHHRRCCRRWAAKEYAPLEQVGGGDHCCSTKLRQRFLYRAVVSQPCSDWKEPKSCVDVVLAPLEEEDC
jgi:hypothetical protein